MERQLKVIGEYWEWVSKKKGELEEIGEEMNKARREIQRLRAEESENKRRLTTLEEGVKETEEIKWDIWSNFALIERAIKIEEELRREGELGSSEEEREGSDSRS